MTAEEADVSPDDFDAFLSKSAIRLNDVSCVWGHNQSSGCGVLHADFAWVAEVWSKRIKRPYSDSTLVIAAKNLSFGLDWHEGETGAWLRRWGVLAE